ncbi:MAG TPA: amidohydrolase family protein [bacterium]
MKGTLYTDGRIYTLDPAPPVVEALAVSGGRIVARGKAADLARDFAEFERIDLGGRTVLPGFIDSHIHLAALGMSLRRVELRDARSLAAAVARVSAAAARARPGEWILGRGWDKNLWPEQRFPAKTDLDAAARDHPVALTSKDGHLLWVNSAALVHAGLDAHSQDPAGGQIERGPDGVPTGLLKEEARELVSRVVPPPGPGTMDTGIREAAALLHSFGVVGVHDFEGPEVFAALQRLAASGELRLRVWNAIPEDELSSAVSCGLRTGFGGEWLRVGPVKIFADGTLGSQTANMLEPFDGQPQNHGIAIHSREELVELVGRAVVGGFWCAIHAIGDRANHWVLEAYAQHAAASARLGARHRIEHVQVVHPGDLSTLARVNVIASMQPVHATADRDIADRYWGPRSRYAYAWRSLLDAGTHLAFGSDAPVETANVMQGLFAAVARRRPEQPPSDAWYAEETLGIAEAVRAYTTGAAFASGGERHSGTLTVGKWADLVVLDRDIMTASADELLQTSIAATIVAGETVYGTGV